MLYEKDDMREKTIADIKSEIISFHNQNISNQKEYDFNIWDETKNAPGEKALPATTSSTSNSLSNMNKTMKNDGKTDGEPQQKKPNVLFLVWKKRSTSDPPPSAVVARTSDRLQLVTPTFVCRPRDATER